MDFDPGSVTVPAIGPAATGAVHGPLAEVTAHILPRRLASRRRAATARRIRRRFAGRQLRSRATTVLGMCGRYASTRSAQDLADLFDALDDTGGDLVPDYNVAPTDPAPIVRMSERIGGPVLSAARWGFVPAWARDPSGAARMINARAETIAESKAYAKAFRERRCLVPADGWFEWRRNLGESPSNLLPSRSVSRQAFFMTSVEPVVFAGVWSTWGAESARIFTFSIITVPARDDLASVHERMPLLLPPDRWNAWLRNGNFAEEHDRAVLLTPPSSQLCATIEIRPVGPEVGNVRADGPSLLQQVAVPSPRSSIVDQSPTLF
jgi:putative SOS response-associated peptidase YedK